MEGCQVSNCGYGGPYQDTWSTKDVIVRNNHYRAIFIGPYNYMGGVGQQIPAGSLTYAISPEGYPIATFTIAQPTGGTVTIPHGFIKGQGVRILGAKILQGQQQVDPPAHSYNDYYPIDSVSSTSFTYKMTVSPGANAVDGTGQVKALWQVGQFVVENNVIELIPHFNNYGPPRGIGLSAAFIVDPAFGTFPVFRRVVIRNNTIRYVDNLTEVTPYNLGINFGSCEDVLVENNVIDLLSPNPLAYGGCTSVRCFNNRDSSGKLIQGSIGAVKQDELTTFIEDAAILAML